ncbi:MAG: hypothetical protein HZA78_10590 [Candidatus Schekmanbacteria bacterium]|nr:hypothetical protein [Candidatus Schekmanbacteria bacterium]
MLSKKGLILAKIETNYGADANPTPANHAVLVSDPQVKVNAERFERDMVRPTLSNVPHVIGRKFVELSFSTELKGSGTLGDPPEISTLLRACGMEEVQNIGVDVQYQPVSNDFESCTVYVYLDGLLHKITGCRGSFELIAAAGEPVRINWKIQGLYQTPVDVAIPAGAVYAGQKGLVFQGVTFSYAGYSTLIAQLSLNLNNKIARHESVNAPHGVSGIEIVGRTPGGAINPEAVSENTHPFWSNWEGANGATLSCLMGALAGNKVQIDSASGGCVKESIAWGERNGIRIYDIPFGLYSANGDDEVRLTFK